MLLDRASGVTALGETVLGPRRWHDELPHPPPSLHLPRHVHPPIMSFHPVFPPLQRRRRLDTPLQVLHHLIILTPSPTTMATIPTYPPSSPIPATPQPLPCELSYEKGGPVPVLERGVKGLGGGSAGTGSMAKQDGGFVCKDPPFAGSAYGCALTHVRTERGKSFSERNPTAGIRPFRGNPQTRSIRLPSAASAESDGGRERPGGGRNGVGWGGGLRV
jgi:hypothetical protein